MSIQINNWKQALLGKTTLGKIAMVIFFGLLAVTIASCVWGCGAPAEAYPLRDAEGNRYRLIEEAEGPSEANGWVGRIAAYAQEGDDTRWIQVAPGKFQDTHQPL